MKSRTTAEAAWFTALVLLGSWAIWLPLLLGRREVEPCGAITHVPGLVVPALAAFAVTALMSTDRNESGRFAARAFGVSAPVSVWVAALSPAMLIAASLEISLLLQRPADLSGLTCYSGMPRLPLLPLFAIVLLVNGFGEEIGWRGFLLPRFQLLFGPVGGIFAVTLVWAIWHAPLFAIIATYRAMNWPTILFGFGLGLLCGSFVLSWLTARAGGNVAPAAVWHSLYNLGTATLIGGLVPAITSTLVMVWGGVIIVAAMLSPAARKRLSTTGVPR